MLNLIRKKTIYNINEKIIDKSDKSIESNSQIILSSPSSKEWKNSIYSYDKDYTKLLVYKDKLVNFLFRSYFNLVRKIVQAKRLRFNPKRFSSNRLFLSEAEIKHTNNNVDITLFVFNKNKNFMKYKLTRLQKKLYKLGKLQWNVIKNKKTKIFVFNTKIFKSSLYCQMKVIFTYIKHNVGIRMNALFNLSKHNKLSIPQNNKILELIKKNAIEEEKRENFWRNLFLSYIKEKKKLVKYEILKKKIEGSLNSSNLYLTSKFKNLIKTYLKINNNKQTKSLSISEIKLLKKNNFIKNRRPITLLNSKRNFKIYKFLYYYQMLVFNKNKFANWFLNYRGFGIISLISKIYNKKVEFNIINLKSMHLNSDIYSEAIALKLKNRKNKLLRVLKKALFRIKLPRLFDLCNNNINNNVIRKKDILNSIKYKLISGVRFEASGRLTRRLIASKAVFKFRYVGSLKNIYSSFVGLSSVMLRGYVKSNLQYTMINSKTRNGAFGLKGWTSSY